MVVDMIFIFTTEIIEISLAKESNPTEAGKADT